MEHREVITITGDDDGFIGLKCPVCSDRFKLSASDINEWNEGDLWCPLCGLASPPSDFLPPEFWKVARQHVENVGVDLMNQFARDLERTFRGSEGLTFKKGPPLRKKPVDEIRQVPEFETVEFECCQIDGKVPQGAALGVAYCPKCGTVRA